jgi:ParB-like nuclease domain
VSVLSPSVSLQHNAAPRVELDCGRDEGTSRKSREKVKTKMKQEVYVSEIVMKDRARRDYGDINSMIVSIKEFGLIQPIVLAVDEHDVFTLVAGGRRLTALKQMNYIKPLIHGRDWVLRDENPTTDEGRLRLKSMELEENLRRKDFDWPEQVAAKANLMKIMEAIHGKQTIGGLTREEKRSGETSGFGVRKLAAMLGESPATVSNDLHLARMVEAMPQLAKASSKSVAQTQSLGVILATAVKAGLVSKNTANAAQTTAAHVAKPLEYRVMVFCKDEAEQVSIMNEMMTRGIKCQAIIV